MKKNLNFYLLILLFILSSSCTQNHKTIAQTENELFIANWNVENLFDTVDDPNKNDEEFLPNGDRNWDNKRLNTKLENLSKVIKYMNYGNGPDILGIEEVENEELLKSLINNYLKSDYYKTAYSESPDERGIDVGLIYNSRKFQLKKVESVKIKFDEPKSSRDILFVKLNYIITNEIINVFVNHWPSRREGLKESEKFRINAAEALNAKISEILEDDQNANVIILGDFNDMPANISISKTLKAASFDCNDSKNDDSELFNLSYNLFQKGEGSYKYKDHWNMLDQIIVSKSLTDNKNLDYICDSFKIIKPEFMIEKGGKFDGNPFPTYGGKKYLGGFSDHFPVGAKFTVKK
ncbi:MAG: endonuclease/exonuclease/phosphatase family protein [Ignavibacteriae bacterium]|nr:endonuclease/exonuclease/phosphatase family protein [Ignavibacteriota bacterium]